MVRQREAWAEGSTNRAEIGVLSAEAASRPRLVGIPGHHVDADEGAVRVLLEGKFTFDVLDLESRLSPYRLLILPDAIAVDAKLKAKDRRLSSKSGGRVLLTGRSGIDPEQGLRLRRRRRMARAPRPTRRATTCCRSRRCAPPSSTIRSSCTRWRSGSRRSRGTSLGDIYDPYFDRSARHFSGHVNTPSQPDPSGFDAGSEKGGFVYFAHPLFTAYKRIGAVAMLEIAEKVVAHALGRRRMIETIAAARRPRHAPPPGRARSATSLHLLHATPVLRGSIRGDNVQPIQDLTSLTDIGVSVEMDKKVRGVRLIPNGEPLEFRTGKGRVEFTVPHCRGHQMVEIAF